MIYELSRMTHDQVAATLAQNISTVLVPLGATEQHGYHLPLSMDTLEVEQVARQTAEKLDCFLAPTLPYGMSLNHMDFKGTMSLTPTTLARFVQELITSLAHHGFKHIIIINGHGGNTAPIMVGAREAKEHCPGVLIAVSDYWNAVSQTYRELLAEHDDSLTLREFSGHGSVMEIAMGLYLIPELVKLDRIVLADATQAVRNETGSVTVVADMKDYTASGSFGTARGADAAAGARILETVAENLSRDIRATIAAFGEKPTSAIKSVE